MPPGNLQFAAEHLSPRHPVHLPLPVQVEEILAGSIGKEVAEGFLGVGLLEDDSCSRGKEIKTGLVGKAPGCWTKCVPNQASQPFVRQSRVLAEKVTGQ